MMNLQQSQHRRQRRRLPNVQRPAKSRPLTFWPTYRGAVDWLRRHHSVLDTTLDLLEIYPSLIRELMLDRFWDFMAPFVTRFDRSASHRRPAVVFNRTKDLSDLNKKSPENGPTNNNNNITNNNKYSHNHHTSSTVHSRKSAIAPCLPNAEADHASHVPIISITYASDEPEPELRSLSPCYSDYSDSCGPGKFPRVFVGHVCRHHHHHRNDSEGDGQKDGAVNKENKEDEKRAEEGVERHDGRKSSQLRHHVLHALQHEFYVRSEPCVGSEARRESQCSPCFHEDVREADACVFVLDDFSLESLDCFKSICAAWAWDVPTVFLKDSNHTLPTPLPDVILHHNLGLGQGLGQGNGQGQESPEVSRASTPWRNAVTPDGGHPSIFRQGRLQSSPGPPLRSLSSNSSFSSRTRKASRRSRQEVREADMVQHLLSSYRQALVFDANSWEESEDNLRKAVHFLLGTGPQSGAKASANGKSSPVPRSPNTLHPLSKGTGGNANFRQRHRSFLEVSGGFSVGSRSSRECLSTPSLPLSPLSPSSITFRHFVDEDEISDDSGRNKTGEIPIRVHSVSDNINNTSFESRNYTNSAVNRDGLTFSRSSLSPNMLSPMSTSPTPMSVSPTPTEITSQSSFSFPPGRSFSHLHQFQQQVQKDRDSYLLGNPLSKGLGSLDDFQERQTTYLIFSSSKQSPKKEPKVVQWPPTSEAAEVTDEVTVKEGNESLSDTFSDSPVSFKDFLDVDLSAIVNKPRGGSDTPDSDNSGVF